MTNKIITTEGNVQFQLGDGSGKIINVHPFHVYTIFNTDTVTFHLIAIPMSSGLSLFTSKAEDLEVNGTVYTFEELPDALSEAFAVAGAQARAEIVDELPETGMTNTIYLVPKPDGEGYDEYIYVNGEWELIGDTSIEFDQFVQKTDFSAYTAATDAKIDAVSGAISSVTEDVAALSGDVTAHTSNTDIHVTAAEKTAWADKYTQAEVDGIVSGLNDSIDAVSGAVADETARAQSAETALHDEIENIDLSDYYTKSQTSGATELSTAFAAKAELSALTEDERVWAEALTDLNGKIGTISGDVDTIEAVLPNKADTSAVTQAVADEATARANADTALSGAVDTALLAYINGAEYVSTAKTINFLNGETVIDSIDATDFIKDGMVSNVEISGGSLVIEFNTDAGKEDIVIPLTDIFDPSNYYTKSQTSGATELSTAFAAKQNVLTAGENIVISGDVISAEAGNDVTELTQAEYDALVEAGTVDPDVLYIITDAAPINLNNYYQKSETSGATELSTAFAAKQNVLTAGSGITISGDVISAEGGSSVTVDPTLDSGSTNPVANSAITANINYIKAHAAKIDGDSFWPSFSPKLIGFDLRSLDGGSTSCVEAFVGNGLIKTDTRYLKVNFTNELTSASTTTQVPSAKAVYDALQSGGGSITIDPSLDSGSTNPVANSAITTAFSGYVTTKTDQTISGRKIFTYSNNSGGKAIEFKQTAVSNKVGFSIKNTADTNNEVASFEFRPNTFTIDGVQHPLMYFGHYRNTKTAAAGVPQTVIGFRQSDQANQASYHFLMPLPEKAKTPFSLTTSFKDFYAPLGFKVNTGGTMVSADETGVVDLSSYISGGGSSYTAGSGIDITNDVISVTGKVDTSDFNTYSGAVESRLAEDEEVTAAAFVALNDRVGSAETAISGKADTATTYTKSEVDTSLATKANAADLGGLKLQQVTQAEYDVLVSGGTVDASTLYVIVN